ncbi:hypothetical protein CDAR_551801 [Caerostris darwini]|uniref:Uncharacterized protein n=1 Tax=Caerostris darwini TaxID=1538125 RepID=A0AAV4QD17_9ARAC|nr:hypothetical protein CDAR_551801 [Caerostris darwini]
MVLWNSNSDIGQIESVESISDIPPSNDSLSFSEICSKIKTSNQQLWKIPPTHPWYNKQAPGGTLTIKADKSRPDYQE